MDLFSLQIPQGGEAVTKSDATVLPVGILYVGVTGDIKVTTYKGDALTFKNVPVGVFYGALVTKVWSTGTTASEILILR
jgi:hypothetical protein